MKFNENFPIWIEESILEIVHKKGPKWMSDSMLEINLSDKNIEKIVKDAIKWNTGFSSIQK